MTVTGHIPEGMTAIEGVNDGMDQINHIQYEMPYFTHSVLGADGKPDRTKPPVLEIDGPRAKELIQVLKDHHTILDPTVALFESFMNTVPLDKLEPGVDHLPHNCMRHSIIHRLRQTALRWQRRGGGR